MALAPRAAASFTAVPRSLKLVEVASTRRMLQPGQIAETMSRSREISWAQPLSALGYVVPPVWSTLRKQPVPDEFDVQAGNPKVERYVARSLSAVGSS